VQPLLQWKSNEFYTTWVCVFVTLGIQHAMRIHLSVICGLPLSTIFFLIISLKVRFSKKKLLIEKYVFIIYTILSKTFLILRINERDIIKMYIGLHVKCPLFLSGFNGSWIFSTSVRKILKYQISLKSVQWESSCSMRTDVQTDGHDEASSRFSQFYEEA
jgi:hypothetical protein